MTNDFPKAFSPQFLCSIAFGPLLPFKGDIAHESNYNNHFWYEEHFVLIVGFLEPQGKKNWAVLEKQAYKSDPSRYENSSWLLAFARLLMLLLYVCFEIKKWFSSTIIRRSLLTFSFHSLKQASCDATFSDFFFWILWLRETKQFREKTEHKYVSSKIEKAASWNHSIYYFHDMEFLYAFCIHSIK